MRGYQQYKHNDIMKKSTHYKNEFHACWKQRVRDSGWHQITFLVKGEILQSQQTRRCILLDDCFHTLPSQPSLLSLRKLTTLQAGWLHFSVSGK